MKLTFSDKIHLYARTSFFSHQVDRSKEMDSKTIIKSIFSNQVISSLKLDLPVVDFDSLKSLSKLKKIELRKEWRQKVIKINHLWLKQMLEEDKSFVEKMTLFWHGHFACDTSNNPYDTLALNNILRRNALGSFKDLLLAVSQSAGMIKYLHLKQNKKKTPNEDFARELCELFTLGRDVDYTENDIKEIARAFTGWSTDSNGDFFFNEKKHDAGEKIIFGKRGHFKGEDVLKLITDNKNTAQFIATKIYRFFVEDNINTKNIDEVTDVLYQTGYDINKTMMFIFNAKWFYKVKGKLIKSPIELLVGIGKMFDLKFPKPSLVIKYQKYLGQILFKPPNVAGWAGGRNWIDASRLAFRLRLGSLILNQGSFNLDTGAELDEESNDKIKTKYSRFYEEVNWNDFFQKNNEIELFEILIRSDNPSLKAQFNESSKETIVQLISTPDFQLT